MSNAVAQSTSKYLTFRLGDEAYAIEILKVQEIIGLIAVTRVPRAPAYFRGVINLRGKVVPVVDLRRKFGLEAIADTNRTCIIVAQIARNGAVATVGLIVDQVSEVTQIAAEQIDPPPSFGAVVDTRFIRGLGKLSQKVLIILDIDCVMTEEEMTAVDHSLAVNASGGPEAA
jgi:purine-binding chemotaxis protein CheW